MSPDSDAPEPLPILPIAKVKPRGPTDTWLVDQLWVASGVGIVGGQPKTFKTWLATELALAVASGGRALGRFESKAQGPVLVFAAEDDPPAMRARFEAVAQARKVPLDELPLYLLDVPELRLDVAASVRRLDRTVKDLRPRLLVLDPFVRLAKLDENSAHEVSAVLGTLRTLQRTHDVAVLLVHHMRKSPSSHPGQQLRGSGDFSAWLDSGLYLTRRADDRLLTVEHRSAAAPDNLRIRLELEPAPHLVLQDAEGSGAKGAAPTTSDSLEHSILQRLSASRPTPTVQLRDQLRVRKETLLGALRQLQQHGRVSRNEHGWLRTS